VPSNTNVPLITPPVTLASHALFAPKGSKMRPNDAPSYYARLLVTKETMATPEWKQLLKAIDDEGRAQFGKDYQTLSNAGQLRLPIRHDVAGKGWPTEFVAFFNVKGNADFPPTIVGRDAHPLMEQKQLYPGCIVRLSLGIYAYGGKGTSFSPGIAFGLRNIQKLDDGPRLAGGPSGGSEFGSLPPSNDAFAEMSELVG
jgi:hypothetical protein